MNKITLIAQREFLTRVKKKTFLLTTILLPLLIFGFYALIIYFAVDTQSNIKIAIADSANIFNGKIESSSNDEDINFQLVQNESAASLQSKTEDGTYNAYVIIPKGYNILSGDSLEILSGKTISITTRDKVSGTFNKLLQDKRYEALQISRSQIDSLNRSASIHFNTISGNSSDSKTTVGFIVGYIAGFLIYIILFIYGTMVMRGVMEEKVSRIAEVIVSSVKPFQLMMGKIIGIGAVGLIQFLIWVAIVFGLTLLLPLIAPGLAHTMQAAQTTVPNAGSQAAAAIQTAADSPGFLQGINEINFPLIIGCFIFYFLGGYLLYSSLFAAVGSAVNEDPQDAQSLLLPITMPIIFAIVIMTKAVNDPGSGIAVFGSLFPLTSPIVMMARVAQGVPDPVPVWELLTSMLLLIIGFLATAWMAAKIYRTGILLYGKKVTWKEMWKWAFRKS